MIIHRALFSSRPAKANLKKKVNRPYYQLGEGTLSFGVEKQAVPMGNQMERSFSLEMFWGKKGIPLEVFLCSRFYRNYGNSATVPFASS